MFVPVICVMLSMAFLVGSYGFIRPAAESLFIHTFGARKLPYVLTAVPLVMALSIYCYGRALSKIGGMKTLLASLIVSISVFLWCFINIEAGGRMSVAALYLFKECYIVILIEQYWSLINSILNSSEAKALNGPIAGGGCLGAILAGFLLQRFAESLGTVQFVLITAGVLMPGLVFSYAAYKLAGDPQPSAEERCAAKGHLHLSLLKENRLLLILVGIVGLSQALATVLNLRMFQILQYALPDIDGRTAYLGGFWMTANILAAVMQFVGTPLLLRFAPLKYIYMGVPLLNVVMCLALFFSPSLAVAAGSLMVFKIMDYSVFRAGKEILYIPLSYDARYRAKQVIDAFTDRVSKGVTGGIMSLAGIMFAVVPGGIYTSFGLLCSLLWTGLGFALVRHTKKTAEPQLS